MLRLLNEATPRPEVLVRVPERVPPPGLAPIATVTLLLYVVSALPLEFCATTTTAGVITRPAVVVLGWTVNARCVAVLPEPAMPMMWLIAASHAAASTATAIIMTCALRMGRSSRLLPVTFGSHIMQMRVLVGTSGYNYPEWKGPFYPPKLPAGVRCAFEFRHPSWFADDVYGLLRAGNAALCVADTEDVTTPLEATADFGYFRLRDEGYTKQVLAKWAETVRDMGRGWNDAFVFFKHEEAGIGPKLAQQFAGMIG